MRVEIGIGDIELSSILIATNLLLSVASIMKRELLKTPYSQKRIIASSFIQIVTNHSIEVLLLKKFIPKRTCQIIRWDVKKDENFPV